MKLKLKIVILILILPLLTMVALAQSTSSGASMGCVLARVDWEDASLYVKSDAFNNEELLTAQSSVGCILLKNPRTLVIVYNVNKGGPDTFLAIPTACIVKITFLKESEEIKGSVKELLGKLEEMLAGSPDKPDKHDKQ
jgi:hypothetical protein